MSTQQVFEAKTYVQDILAGLVPSDPEFGEVWALIPEMVEAFPASEIISLADKIRSIRRRRRPVCADCTGHSDKCTACRAAIGSAPHTNA